MPCPPPGHLPDPGIKPPGCLLCLLPRQAGSLPLAPPAGSPRTHRKDCIRDKFVNLVSVLLKFSSITKEVFVKRCSKKIHLLFYSLVLFQFKRRRAAVSDNINFIGAFERWKVLNLVLNLNGPLLSPTRRRNLSLLSCCCWSEACSPRPPCPLGRWRKSSSTLTSIKMNLCR